MSGRVFEVKSAQSSQTPELTILSDNDKETEKNRHQWRREDGHRNGV